MIIGHINGSMIKPGTIRGASISSITIDNLDIEPKEFENDVISWDEYNTWRVPVKNCVIHGVPEWSSMANMVGKTDANGNMFVGI